MTAPWIEINEYQELDVPGAGSYSETAWQGRFACQAEILPHQEWLKLKWGINAFFLLEESLERQKLFLESQYTYPDESGLETKDRRTLAFRFISRPGEGLQVAILGKIHARTESDARENASAYCDHLQSIFPYDHPLSPAITQPEFRHLCGEDILADPDHEIHMAAIKRMEFCANSNQPSLFLSGFWRSGPHAHEQIWHHLADSAFPLILNMTLRSTVLYEEERDYLQKLAGEILTNDETSAHPAQAAALQQWKKEVQAHLLAPWKKLFYLQVHLASSHKLSEFLFHTIGNSLTLHGKNDPLPGYQVVRPRQNDTQGWQMKLMNLEPIFSDSFLTHSRLSEVADLNEVFEVMQLPYSPPDHGVPVLKYHSGRSR